MRINSDDISTEGKRVTRIRVDRIGAAGSRELWWVALGFADETTKPEGMFTDRAAALELGELLAAEWGVGIAISHGVAD